ncbi:hypothetical protein Afil01_12170 [Actinorhabdospora filicis]|uniref:Uncharacterized protein n=1 Tax=Actinorhabdospora filicis TaxID=1785913 RepID=A0A9W6SI58_9ACTN|nr:hypothetical protein [Actinorhabdospora filicis]GLZ76410.1 hypothetical protein Afil01_12170 [Actinorhabdospora filicis]
MGANIDYYTERARQGRAWVDRLDPIALGVRVAVFATGALAIGLSGTYLGFWRVTALGLAVALMPTLRPAGPWATLLIVVCLGVLLMGGETENFLTLFPIAALLYAHHQAAAQAVTLRTDTYTPPDVIMGLLRRTGVTLLISAILAAVFSLLPGVFQRTSSLVVAAIGLVAVVGLVCVLTAMGRRKR